MTDQVTQNLLQEQSTEKLLALANNYLSRTSTDPINVAISNLGLADQTEEGAEDGITGTSPKQIIIGKLTELRRQKGDQIEDLTLEIICEQFSINIEKLKVGLKPGLKEEQIVTFYRTIFFIIDQEDLKRREACIAKQRKNIKNIHRSNVVSTGIVIQAGENQITGENEKEKTFKEEDGSYRLTQTLQTIDTVAEQNPNIKKLPVICEISDERGNLYACHSLFDTNSNSLVLVLASGQPNLAVWVVRLSLDENKISSLLEGNAGLQVEGRLIDTIERLTSLDNEEDPNHTQLQEYSENYARILKQYLDFFRTKSGQAGDRKKFLEISEQNLGLSATQINKLRGKKSINTEKLIDAILNNPTTDSEPLTTDSAQNVTADTDNIEAPENHITWESLIALFEKTENTNLEYFILENFEAIYEFLKTEFESENIAIAFNESENNVKFLRGLVQDFIQQKNLKQRFQEDENVKKSITKLVKEETFVVLPNKSSFEIILKGEKTGSSFATVKGLIEGDKPKIVGVLKQIFTQIFSDINNPTISDIQILVEVLDSEYEKQQIEKIEDRKRNQDRLNELARTKREKQEAEKKEEESQAEKLIKDLLCRIRIGVEDIESIKIEESTIAELKLVQAELDSVEKVKSTNNLAKIAKLIVEQHLNSLLGKALKDPWYVEAEERIKSLKKFLEILESFNKPKSYRSAIEDFTELLELSVKLGLDIKDLSLYIVFTTFIILQSIFNALNGLENTSALASKKIIQVINSLMPKKADGFFLQNYLIKLFNELKSDFLLVSHHINTRTPIPFSPNISSYRNILDLTQFTKEELQKIVDTRMAIPSALKAEMEKLQEEQRIFIENFRSIN